MSRQPTRVEVLPLEPSEYIDVLENSGLTSRFEISLDHGIGKRQVQCDHWWSLHIRNIRGASDIFHQS